MLIRFSTLAARAASSLIFLIPLLASQPAVAQDLSAHLGPLAGQVRSGRDGPWEVGPANGWAMFSNVSDPSAVRSYVLEDPRLTGATYTISVNTAMQPAGNDVGYGGILLDLADDGAYFGFAVGAGGELVLLENSSNGLRIAETEQTIRAKLDGSDILEVAVAPGAAQLSINGQQVFTINDPNNVGFAPRVGLIVLGTGRFAFHAYDITIANAGTGGGGGTPFPPPGGGGGGGTPFPPPGGGGGGTTGGGGGGTGGGTAGGGGTPPSAQDIYVSQVILGVTLGVFFHELGHAVIGELELPATGPEEDVADGFAAFIMSETIDETASADEIAFVEALVRYSSLAWYYNGLNMERSGKVEPWQDEHAPSLKRFRNSFCIIYGSDPGRFESFANQVGLDERTRSRCLDEYAKRYRAWETILQPVSRNLGPDAPGAHPIDTPGGRVLVNFGPTSNEFGRVVVSVLGDTQLMAQTAGELERLFVWPRDLKIEFRDCDEVNAWYDPQAGSVTMCYSAIEFFSKIVFDAEGAGGGTGGGGTGGGGGGSGGVTDADAMQFLVGNWTAQVPGNDGRPMNVSLSFTADMRYQFVIPSPQGQITVIGTWTARVNGSNVDIALTPTDWSPRQSCDANGNCQPNVFSPYQFPIQVLSQASFNDAGVTWQRAQ